MRAGDVSEEISRFVHLIGKGELMIDFDWLDKRDAKDTFGLLVVRTPPTPPIIVIDLNAITCFVAVHEWCHLNFPEDSEETIEEMANAMYSAMSDHDKRSLVIAIKRGVARCRNIPLAEKG